MRLERECECHNVLLGVCERASLKQSWQWSRRIDCAIGEARGEEQRDQQHRFNSSINSDKYERENKQVQQCESLRGAMQEHRMCLCGVATQFDRIKVAQSATVRNRSRRIGVRTYDNESFSNTVQLIESSVAHTTVQQPCLKSRCATQYRCSRNPPR